MEVSAAEAGVTHEASPDDPSVRHTIRSLPPLTLRLPLALRQQLAAQAQAAGQSLNTYLTQILAAAVAGVHVPLDEDLTAWLQTFRRNGEDVGQVMARQLALLRALFEDDVTNAVLVLIPPDLQPWLTAQAQRNRSHRREQALLRLLRRAAQGPIVAPGRPRHLP
jgi:HicB family